MATYRVTEFSQEQRVVAAQQMLNPDREWGLVTDLARDYGVSRSLLYEIRNRALRGIIEAMVPGEAGRPAQESTLTVDKGFIDRMIAILPMLTGSVRHIQFGLELILGIRRSVGYISERLKRAGEEATTYNQEIRVPLPVLGEADEIFQGRKPCLTVVDGRSFLVLTLTPAEARDGTTWGLTYLELVGRGIEFHDLACDGGTGLRAGVREAELAIPLRPDLFHLLQEAHRLSRRLEGAAYKAMENAERARRADLEARGIIRRRGRRLKIKVPLPQAAVEEGQAIERFDTWSWLLGEIRQALEPISPAYHLVSVAQTQDTIKTALALLKELNHPAITSFAEALQEKISELIAPLQWLEHQLAPLQRDLDDDTQAFLFWGWQHRQALDIAADFPVTLQPVRQPFWEALSLFHRSSSLAESLHSWLRPYLQIHRGMPQWLFPLLQLFWNHHQFERGERAGHSPLHLAGLTDTPSLNEVLDQLFGPQPA